MFYYQSRLAFDLEGLQHFLRVRAHWRQLVDISAAFEEIELVGRHQAVRADTIALEIAQFEALNSPSGYFGADECLQGVDGRLLVDLDGELRQFKFCGVTRSQFLILEAHPVYQYRIDVFQELDFVQDHVSIRIRD